ncbi:MAG TPA: hypothetical protein VM285_05415 [Polyangia bacterium]|nr:hypothetical protein [Polyangia bacterium]
MRSTTIAPLLALAALALLLVACGDDSGTTDGGPDASTDADSDGDSDGDGDTDNPECPSPQTSQEEAGLSWRRCLAGECWDDEAGECAGDALEVTWDEAEDACPEPFRLPTHEELIGLLGDCVENADTSTWICSTCFDSPFCDSAFPGVEDLPDLSRLHLHWAADEFSGTEGWSARFKDGTVKPDTKTKKFTAACVRDE